MVDVFSVLFGGLQYTSKGRRLNLAPRSSLLAALLFAVHPVHTECVSIIHPRHPPLCRCVSWNRLPLNARGAVEVPCQALGTNVRRSSRSLLWKNAESPIDQEFVMAAWIARCWCCLVPSYTHTVKVCMLKVVWLWVIQVRGQDYLSPFSCVSWEVYSLQNTFSYCRDCHKNSLGSDGAASQVSLYRRGTGLGGQVKKGLSQGTHVAGGWRSRTWNVVVPGLCRDAAAILWVELESGSPSPAVELLTNSPHLPSPLLSPLHYSPPLYMWFGSSWWAWPAVLWAMPLFHWAAAEYIWYKPYGVFRNHATPTSMGTLWKCKSSCLPR